MQKQVRVRIILFVFRVFCTAANHSKQNTMRVWNGLYRVFLLIIFETNCHFGTDLHLALIYIFKSLPRKKFFLSFFLS